MVTGRGGACGCDLMAVVVIVGRRRGRLGERAPRPQVSSGGIWSSSSTLRRWLGIFWSLRLVVGEGMVVECRGVAWAESLVPVWRVVLCLGARGVCEKWNAVVEVASTLSCGRRL